MWIACKYIKQANSQYRSGRYTAEDLLFLRFYFSTFASSFDWMVNKTENANKNSKLDTKILGSVTLVIAVSYRKSSSVDYTFCTNCCLFYILAIKFLCTVFRVFLIFFSTEFYSFSYAVICSCWSFNYYSYSSSAAETCFFMSFWRFSRRRE